MKKVRASLLLFITTCCAPSHHSVVVFSFVAPQASYQLPLANHSDNNIKTLLTSCVTQSTNFHLFANKVGDIDSSSSSSEIVKGEDDDSIISTQPPKFLSLRYKIASFTNIISGLLLLININTIQKSIAISSSSVSDVATAATKLLSSSASTRYQPNLLATYTAGTLGYLFLSSGVCNILSKAAKATVSNSSCRLYTSDTYKRLNKGILLFSIISFSSIPGEAGCLLFSTNNDNKMRMLGVVAFITIHLTNLLTAATSFIGWEYSVSNNGFGESRSKDRMKKVFKEVGKGFKNIYNNFPVTEQRPATFYRTFWILLSIGNILFNVPELIFNIQQFFLRGGGGGIGRAASSLIPISLTISSIARLGLLSFILYVLKDAAERKRLEGTTFIKLNMMVGLWAFGVGIAQGLMDIGLTTPFNMRRAADKFLFGLLFLNNGLLTQLSKMGIIKNRDEIDPDAPC